MAVREGFEPKAWVEMEAYVLPLFIKSSTCDVGYHC
jgi:hypothetical protein